MHERLWRLLGACERLARDESVALAHRDFTGLAKTQQTKAALLADLAAEANLVHASANSSARNRLVRLLDCNRRNSQILSGMMDSAREERRKLRSTFNQLQTLRAAYKTRAAARQETFSAHG